MMIIARKHMLRRLVLGFSSLLLLVGLAGCTINIGGTGSATPTPKPTPTQPPAPTPTPALALTTYTATSYSIGYPASAGWTKQVSGPLVTFQDAQQLNKLAVGTVPNPGGTQSADSVATASLTTLESAFNVKNAQPANVPATTTVAGESWTQKGITGNVTANGVTVPVELIVLADNHPASSANTQTYEIGYAGPTAIFSQTNAAIFQPMLQSFKFTA